MLKNRKIQMFGMILLIVAAVLVSLSAVRAPAPAFVPVTGSNAEGLAQYQRSERSASLANQNGLAIYQQSERSAPAAARDGQAIYHQSERYAPAAVRNGLAIYQQSERFTPAAVRDGLAIYHLSERMQPVNWTKSSDPLYKYHQSEWFGK